MHVEGDNYVSTSAIGNSIMSFVRNQRLDILNAGFATVHIHFCCVELTAPVTGVTVTHSTVNGINQSEIAATQVVLFINPVHLRIIDTSIGFTDEGSTLSFSLCKIIEVIDVVVHCRREVNEAINAIDTGTAKYEVAANPAPT